MSKRIDIKAILADPAQRRALMVPAIIALQAREGIVCTPQQAAAAYDAVLAQRKPQSGFDRVMFGPEGGL